MAVEDLVSKASPDELATCIRLLAQNVALYRRKFPTIPLDGTPPSMASPDNESTPDDASEKIIEEALRLAAEKQEKRKPKTRLIENREYARIQVHIPVEVIRPDLGIRVSGKLNDLSWGGASFTVSGTAGKIGDEIQLNLPFIRGAEDISITSRIIRISDAPNVQRAAVRFTSLSVQDDIRLERVLLLLLKQQDGDRRKYPRLARRIEVEYTSESDWQATLENLSQGGMSLILPDPVGLDQSVQLMLSETSQSARLTLRGRVVRVEPINFDATLVYQVNLTLEHPSETLRESIGALLNTMTLSGRDELPKAKM